MIDICIDFDGTIVTHEYPYIGKPVPGAERVMKLIQEKGHNIILFTMRSGKELDNAVEYIESLGINLYGINENPTQKTWTQSPKAYGQIYIDDAALGCPLKFEKTVNRPFVDWEEIEKLLNNQCII